MRNIDEQEVVGTRLKVRHRIEPYEETAISMQSMGKCGHGRAKVAMHFRNIHENKTRSSLALVDKALH